MFGFLNVRKPGGKTAHDVVAAVRRITRIKQVGHGGTLDPMAVGVLPVAVGKACRLLRFLEGRKAYLAEVRLGQRTTTDDIEGDTIGESCSVDALPDESVIIAALAPFNGTIKQFPPLYSAVHVNGKRLYELARAGKEVENIPERIVQIHFLEVVSYQAPVLTLRISCGAGTYIRSIARDLGETLGCGGCLQALTREAAGPFELAESFSLEELRSASDENRLTELLVPPERVLLLEKFSMDLHQARKIQMGQVVTLPPGSERAVAGLLTPEALEAQPDRQPEYFLAMHDETIVAVCTVSIDETGEQRLIPEVVLSQNLVSPSTSAP